MVHLRTIAAYGTRVKYQYSQHHLFYRDTLEARDNSVSVCTDPNSPPDVSGRVETFRTDEVGSFRTP
jgi:hypothetical protein